MGSSVKKLGRRLGVIIALALSVTGATVASAQAGLPEFSYTLPTSPSFSGGQMVLESESPRGPVTCTSTTGEATWTAYKSVSAILRLKGCTQTLFGFRFSCASAGLAEGEIATKTLAARVEYLSKAHHEAGMIFNAGGKTSTVASFVCGGSEPGAIRGEFLAAITPVNTYTGRFSLLLTGAKGTPQYTQFEKENGEKVTLYPLEVDFDEEPFTRANFKASAFAFMVTKNAELKA
jgi:hypothetical protein